MKVSMRIFSFLLAVVLLVGIIPVTAQARGDVKYGIGFVNADTLKLYKNPSAAAPVVDTAAKDECVVVVSKVGSWYKVIYNLKEGYMSGASLSVLTRENAELGYGKVNGQSVYLRSGPGTSFRSVNLANLNEKVYIIGLNTGWYKVIFEGRICYIRSDYVDLTEIPYENQDSEYDPLFFRLGKSTGIAPSADALKNAANKKPEVVVPEETKPEETIPEETVPEETVPEETVPEETVPEETKPEEDKPQQSPAPQEQDKMYGIGFVTASALRLRAQANTTSAIVATASKNECVVVVSKEGSWYKVIYNLKEGYMHSDYLSVLTKENAELGYGKVLSDGTIFTAGPGVSFKQVATAKQGEKAYIIGLNEGWYKVIFGEYVCYVPSNSLELTEIPYENRESTNYPKFFRMGRSIGLAPSADALKQPTTPSTGTSADGALIVATAKKYLGVPYVWGGASPSGFDCSGLVYYVFKTLGYSMYRTPADQYRQGTYVSRQNLQPGDVVFFYNTVPGTGISHVGIYVGDGKFIHSPNSRSVVSIASLDNVYWNQHYYGARRMTK